MKNETDSTDSPSKGYTRSPQILIIDDETLIRRTLADYLTECGYQAATAIDGIDGLAQARSGNFNAILVDLRMPHVDGLKVISTLKSEQPALPIVVLSGTGVLSDAIEAMRQGAWDYLAKPIQDMDEVVVALQRVLNQAQLRAERDRYQHQLEELNRSLEAEIARQVQDLQIQNRELAALNRVSYAISAHLKWTPCLPAPLMPRWRPLKPTGVWYTCSTRLPGNSAWPPPAKYPKAVSRRFSQFH